MSGKKKVLSLKHLTSRNFGKIPEEPNLDFHKMVASHLESFNFFLNEGLGLIVKRHQKAYLELPNSSILCIYIKEIYIEPPTLPIKVLTDNRMIYPRECLERGETYKGQLTALIGWSVDGEETGSMYKSFGDAPIMVQSDLCNLRMNDLSPKELVEKGELPNEAGGYFIINGKKRVLRMLIVNRRHYPFSMTRDSWKKLENGMTNKGIMMRCTAEDETALVNILHYMKSGHVKLSCQLRDVVVPIIMCMQALVDFTDLRILRCIAKGREHDADLVMRIKFMLSDSLDQDIYNQTMARKAIGSNLKNCLPYRPPNCSDEEACDLILTNHVLPHLPSYEAKFYMLCFMVRKLFSFVAGECLAESVDDTSMQEVWLGGFTCLHFIKNRFEDYIDKAKRKVAFSLKKNGPDFVIDNDFMKKSSTMMSFDIGSQFKNLISSGSLKTKKFAFGIPQYQGLTVVVEHLNKLRDISHFRAIHRGKFFIEMKSMEPRKFNGEAFGFLCPIHTPDGAPCGLLNHLSHDCVVTTGRPSSESIRKLLVIAGMDNIDYPLISSRKNVEVILDGGIVGFVDKDEMEAFVRNMKTLRVLGKIDKYTEIANTKQFEFGGKYPAIFIFSSAGRLSRPVINYSLGTEEYVGSLEQLYLNVAGSVDEIEVGVHTHYERSITSMFSNVGRFVPFLDHNPSPRNLYQCQMAKQTMGIPIHNWRVQTENKLYRLLYPQVPLVRNKHYDDMHMEEFAMGTNACVAIVSYSGYDMEDAMVINKASIERGFANAMMYKSEFIDLAEESKRVGAQSITFERDPDNERLAGFLSADGLPFPQQRVCKGDPYYCTYNETEKKYRVVIYAGETCFVDKVSLMVSGTTNFQKANITLRIKRNPIIGDKFASRSGQKGIMSRTFPSEDMPFSDRGIVPDILFNPHGIPSRMTAGTLLEVVAGKAAAEYGLSFDSTPFIFNDENPATDYYGKILEAAGFDYFGQDTLYNGYSGEAISCHIFSGLVYYQRLRHMVSDKWQVRSSGPINMLTRQPIKGRNKGGAIRFGEMERDCLISHGAAYALQDRLMDCSDATKQYVCGKCGDFLSTSPYVGDVLSEIYHPRAYCRHCGEKATVRRVNIPYAFKVLLSELASMNIQVQLNTLGTMDIVNEL